MRRTKRQKESLDNIEMTLDQRADNVIHALASIEKPKSEEEFPEDLAEMEETNADLHQWLSQDSG